MKQDNFKDCARDGIVAKSIEVLYNRGVEPEKISRTMLQAFAVDPETVQKLIERAAQKQL